MSSDETITLTRREYDALNERIGELEDILATREADDGIRVPHHVALDIIRGKSPIRAFRNHQGMTLRELSEKAGIAPGYISEIERGLKPGSAYALGRIASVLGTTIDVLVRR